MFTGCIKNFFFSLYQHPSLDSYGICVAVEHHTVIIPSSSLARISKKMFPVNFTIFTIHIHDCCYLNKILNTLNGIM